MFERVTFCKWSYQIHQESLDWNGVGEKDKKKNLTLSSQGIPWQLSEAYNQYNKDNRKYQSVITFHNQCLFQMRSTREGLKKRVLQFCKRHLLQDVHKEECTFTHVRDSSWRNATIAVAKVKIAVSYERTYAHKAYRWGHTPDHIRTLSTDFECT